MNAAFVTFDGGALTIEDIVALAERRRTARLSEDPAFIARIDRGAARLDAHLQRHGVIYGITTGYGDSCTQIIPPEHHARLASQLYTFHGVGLGDHFDAATTRTILAVRLQSLAQGYSGVRYGLLRQIAALLAHDLLPRIPQEGSVGASGDLTPLSYLAAVIAGEREVLHHSRVLPAAIALRECGLSPWPLTPKETLALMNGTAVMTAQACLVWRRAAYLAECATRLTSLLVVALRGHVEHFDAALFACKPHPGPQRVAARLRDDLHGMFVHPPARLQDRYSLRCAPHIIGVLEDTLRDLKPWLENELNSSNDNPLIDPDQGQIWHGGHFYGGHIAQAMDSLKIAVAQLADLLDRQLAQLVDPKFNAGLPANLSGATGPNAPLHHGCKALQIAVSAWAAEWQWSVPVGNARAYLWIPANCREVRGVVLAHHNMIEQGILEERWLGAAGAPTLWNGRACRIRSCAELEAARLGCTSPQMFTTAAERAAFDRLLGRVRQTIWGNDAYGAGLVAAGLLDLVVEADLEPYDVLPLVPVVEGAGGVVSDWEGRPPGLGHDQRMVVAGDPRLHAQAVALLAA